MSEARATDLELGPFARHLIESSSLAIAVFDRALVCVRCNDAFDRFFGGQVRTVGANLRDLASAEDGGEVPVPEASGGSVARLRFLGRSGRTQVAAGHLVWDGDTLVFLGERTSLTDVELSSQMARLHEQLINTTRDLHKKNADLVRAQSKIKVLSGLIPICSVCKNIRDDEGYWSRIERYVSEHSDAEFSHGYCPDCFAKIFPDDDDE